MSRSLLRSVLLALVLSACATDEAPTAEDTASEAQDATVRAELGSLEPAFDGALTELAARRGLPDVSQLRALRTETDELGITHVRVQQMVGGVPVWGGEAIVHLDEQGAEHHVTDKIEVDLDVDTVPTLDAFEAEDRALDAEQNAELLDAETTLFVLRRDGQDHLVWQVDVEVRDAEGLPLSRPRLFVDARSGEVVWSYDNLKTGSGATRYDGTQSFTTTHSTWGWYGTSYSSWALQASDINTYTWGSTTTSLNMPMSYFVEDWSGYPSAVSAHWAAEETLDYLAAWHGYVGYDGAGSAINVYTDYGSGWNNASGGGGGIWFGNGDGTSWSSFTTVDVVAHEIGHNMTEKMSNLVYSGESGGMNESFSDLMGVMVERWVDGGSSNNWRIMEDNYTPSTSGDAGRYMLDPAADGGSMDYYTSASAVAAADVHYSSGIGNLAFSLLSNGGYHPRRSSGYVSGVGPDAAMWIAFRAHRYYLTSTSDYADLRDAMTLAAADGYGATSWVVDSVESAYAAVGVGSTGCETGYLEGTGYADIVPDGSYFWSSGGTLAGELSFTSGANVGLHLYRWSGSGWSWVAGSATGSGEQSVSYSASSGYYLWWAYSHSGAANYSFCKR